MTASVATIDFSEALDFGNIDGASPQKVVNELMTSLINTLELSLDQQIDTLSVSEKKIVEMTIQEAKTFQEQLAKQEKANKKGKILKALGVIGTILAAIMTVFFPSPLSIALLVASVAMTLEPLMADLMNYDSMIEKMMEGLQKGMTEVFGELGGMIATVLVMAVVAVGSASLAAKFGAQVGSMAARQCSQVAEGLSKLKEMLSNGFKHMMNTKMLQNLRVDMTVAQEKAVQHFFDAIQTAIVFSQAGVQIDYSLVKKAGAELMKELTIEGNEIGFWTDMVDMLKSDVESTMQSRTYAWSVITK